MAKIGIKQYIKYTIYLSLCTIKKSQLLLRKTNGNDAFVFSCPDHGNAGDIAIEKAEECFLRDIGRNAKLIYVRTLIENIGYVYRNLSKDTLICLQGGGSFGGLYPQADLERLLVFKLFKKNTIVSFPQTICLVDDFYVEKYKRILKKRNNIHLFFREEESYREARKLFPFMLERIYLVPDAVFYLKDKINVTQNGRKNVTVTLRKDKEKGISAEFAKKIIKEIENKYGEVIELDTYKELKGDIKGKDNVLKNVLSTYASSRAIVTDRLHGMILAFITGTPCVAISNNNGKVKNEYNTWLKDCPYIRFTESRDVRDIIDDIKKAEEADTNRKEKYKNEFSSLINVCKID